ncbi:MAG: hypothetical protein V3S29_07815, partial [bacterium]
KDLTEISSEIKKGLKITGLRHVQDMLEIGLERMPDPVLDPEPDNEPKGGVKGDLIQPAPGADEIPPTVYT